MLAPSEEAFDTPLSPPPLNDEPGPATGLSGDYPDGTHTRRLRPASRTQHKHDFNIRCFSSRDDLLRVLDDGERPDALLCDIYFYPPGEAEQFEEEVREKRRILEELAKRWDAHAHEEGIDIIEMIKRKYNPSFPIFAYTAKAPYLMASDGFDRLIDLDIRLLLKDRLGQEAERAVITEGIEAARSERGWRKILKNHLRLSMALSGIIGIVIENILSKLLSSIF